MNNIITLASIGKGAESTRFQMQLNKLIEEGEVYDLSSLLQATEKALEKYR